MGWARTIEGAQDLTSLWIFFDVFNNIDQIGHLRRFYEPPSRARGNVRTDLREERIVIRECVGLLVVIARLADVEHRLNVWIHESAEC